MSENIDSSVETSDSREALSFSHFEWREPILKAINELNYKDCTPIQEQAFGPILDGKDLAGLAQTGTGKTAAFLLPLIERILCSISINKSEIEDHRSIKDWIKGNFILILVPTRELAIQVVDNIKKLTKFTDLNSGAFFGGVGYDKQIEVLQSGCDLVVGTPGRLIDLYKEGHIDLKLLRAVVFDEADRMFDMGFKDDMKYLLQRMPRERQMLLFSATLNLDVLNTAYQFGAEPIEINVSRDKATADNVEDKIFHVGSEEKPAYLLSLLKKHNPAQCIVFSNFKHNIDRLAQFLNNNGLKALGISSLLNQSQRNRVMKQFKTDHTHNILIATDVAARGLDIKGVDMVINMELPDDAENYVHRIGRTGRANSKGVALSLVSDRDVDSMARIEDYLKKKLESSWLDDGDLLRDFTPLRDVDKFSDIKDENRPRQFERSRPSRAGGRNQRGNFRDSNKSGERRFSKGRNEQSGSTHRDKRHGRHASEGESVRDERLNREAGLGHPHRGNKNFRSDNNKNRYSHRGGQKPYSKDKKRYDRHPSRQQAQVATKSGFFQKIASTISSWFK